MSRSALKRRAKEARGWLLDSCFPLWAEDGLAESGLFREVFDLDHEPVDQATTRVRVQARQTYVFAEALRMGWKPDIATKMINAGVSTLTQQVRRPDGLVGKTLHMDGNGLDNDAADLYDTAFVLFALADASHALGDDAPLETANEILRAVDASLKDSADGGYAEALPAPPTRSQNPHMHLFEACLALHRAEPEGGHLVRAGGILALFETYFTAGAGGLLGEFFGTGWSTPVGNAAIVVEPGHQFEWVWLLHKYAKATGTQVSHAAERLYAFGLSTLDASGGAVQEVTREGAPVDASRRSWPQTEALKAHLAMFEASGDEHYAAHACASFDLLMDTYLTEQGGWMDHVDADGAILAKDMPASTGYHVVLALAELIRIAQA